MKIQTSKEMAHCIAMDAANRNMRHYGRKAWNEDDYNLCKKTFNELWPISEEMKAALQEVAV